MITGPPMEGSVKPGASTRRRLYARVNSDGPDERRKLPPPCRRRPERSTARRGRDAGGWSPDRETCGAGIRPRRRSEGRRAAPVVNRVRVAWCGGGSRPAADGSHIGVLIVLLERDDRAQIEYHDPRLAGLVEVRGGAPVVARLGAEERIRRGEHATVVDDALELPYVRQPPIDLAPQGQVVAVVECLAPSESV